MELGLRAQAVGECEEPGVLLLGAGSGFKRGREHTLTGTVRANRFVVTGAQPCLEMGAERGQIERLGAIPVSVPGSEGQGGLGEIEIVGVDEGDVAERWG